jgi:starch synthase
VHVSAEVSPFHKSGGLGDVLAGLPGPLARAGVDVRIVTGLMGDTTKLDSIGGRSALTPWPHPVEIGLGGQPIRVQVHEARTHGGEVITYFIEAPHLSRGGLYGHDDDVYRFAILSKAAVAVASILTRGQGLGPVVAIHAHDWHAALAVYYARAQAPALRDAKTLFTIHNLAYQGLAPASESPYLDVRWDDFHGAFEYAGALNLMKGALVIADRITTVSPTYAREIQTAEYGNGLDGLLRALSGKLRGVANGIDVRRWNPATDPAIAADYSAVDPEGKALCTADLRWELGLAAPKTPAFSPLLGAVTRLTSQKGIDWLCDAADGFIRDGGQLVVLGEGDAQLEHRLHWLAMAHPGRVAFRRAFDEGLAHRIYAGADLFAMPSRFEPCGLTQLYAMRYGALPVARATGGLVDTIAPLINQYDVGGANGFLYEGHDGAAFSGALRWATHVFRDPGALAAMRGNAMRAQHSWDDRARAYVTLYRELGIHI